MSAYYNEIDPYAAQWLRNLIAAGLIAPGDVDERSIVEIKPDELSGYTQCHFFAGIGVWSHALRSAGWPDSRPVWTGSCPCQPFSAAGKGDGTADSRHLWPAWFKLIDERRPVVCFGEQVASADGLAWLDLVHADLEEAGYAVGALDLCAAGAGAPHIRQRLYLVADAQRNGGRSDFAGRQAQEGETDGRTGGIDGVANAQQPTDRSEAAAANNQRTQADRPADWIGRRGDADRLGNAALEPINGDARSCQVQGHKAEQERRQPGRASRADGLAHADSQERRPTKSRTNAGADGRGYVRGRSDVGELGNAAINGRPEQQQRQGQGEEPDAPNSNTRSSFWSDAIWLDCRDGKRRPAPPEPEFQPLAYGAAARVGRLRAYGNAIVAPLAAEFIAAYMQVPA